MKTADAVIIGAGVIGLAIANSLKRSGAEVVVLERGQPGQEASSASAGMLAHRDPETPLALREIIAASAALYPDWIANLQADSGVNVDLRSEGTLYIVSAGKRAPSARALSMADVESLEPCLENAGLSICLLEESSIDSRLLIKALVHASHHNGIHLHGGNEVSDLNLESGSAFRVKTQHDEYSAGAVINCAGAWAGSVGKMSFPVRPVKGQMFSLLARRKSLLRHMIRSEGVYLVPRSDGRILVGATVEEVGFDKRVDAAVVLGLHKAAANLIPELAEAKIHESWSGLRPGTTDELPILGQTSVPGYYMATGHFRNGILLAPVTARIITNLILGQSAGFEMAAFNPMRFGNRRLPRAKIAN